MANNYEVQTWCDPTTEVCAYNPPAPVVVPRPKWYNFAGKTYVGAGLQLGASLMYLLSLYGNLKQQNTANTDANLSFANINTDATTWLTNIKKSFNAEIVFGVTEFGFAIAAFFLGGFINYIEAVWALIGFITTLTLWVMQYKAYKVVATDAGKTDSLWDY